MGKGLKWDWTLVEFRLGFCLGSLLALIFGLRSGLHTHLAFYDLYMVWDLNILSFMGCHILHFIRMNSHSISWVFDQILLE